ncbi:hypothetical protein TrispH2_000778 [Trichoplax sp. H2]|nr:hypothetical protein TrispH2_000778 [Trichoplax sp. H2]|eukprot:RDD47673.1 hypothetical protein TrispH2_000778 [Trichoplax sp. H2]
MKIAIFTVLFMMTIISVESLFINDIDDDDMERNVDLLQEYRSIDESGADPDKEDKKSWVVRSFYKRCSVDGSCKKNKKKCCFGCHRGNCVSPYSSNGVGR